MRYIYGPVKSRRLGLSLGINLTPYKICTFDCIYCQLGHVANRTMERKEYIDISEIRYELKSWLENNQEEAKILNYITFSGSGEPTLNIKISELIERIKEISSVPVALITNSSLLGLSSLRKELLRLDLIVPSLDAAREDIFQEIDRPEAGLRIEGIIEGLISLRKEFRGKIWLEVMLVKGINDDLRHIRRLKEAIERINPDKIQLNSPVRTTAEPNILPVAKAKLNKINKIFGEKCQII